MCKFPHHQSSEQLLLQYFYNGLALMEQNVIDAASRGAMVDKTLKAARALILNIVANSQQFSNYSEAPMKVNEVTITPSNV